MKRKTWIHVALEVGCVALLLLQGRRIQKLQQSELLHHQKALQVRQLFFGCTEILNTVGVADGPSPRRVLEDHRPCSKLVMIDKTLKLQASLGEERTEAVNLLVAISLSLNVIFFAPFVYGLYRGRNQRRASRGGSLVWNECLPQPLHLALPRVDLGWSLHSRKVVVRSGTLLVGRSKSDAEVHSRDAVVSGRSGSELEGRNEKVPASPRIRSIGNRGNRRDEHRHTAAHDALQPSSLDWLAAGLGNLLLVVLGAHQKESPDRANCLWPNQAAR